MVGQKFRVTDWRSLSQHNSILQPPKREALQVGSSGWHGLGLDVVGIFVGAPVVGAGVGAIVGAHVTPQQVRVHHFVCIRNLMRASSEQHIHELVEQNVRRSLGASWQVVGETDGTKEGLLVGVKDGLLVGCAMGASVGM